MDKVGPKVFKNFDKMKLIMKDPQLGHGKYRSKSFNDDLSGNLEVDQNMHKWLDEHEKDKANDHSRNASRGHSRNNSNSNNNNYGGAVSGGVSGGVSAGVSAISDYTLTYQE